ncbi:hypothetical protein CR513_30894, partial [Mucuna pruriens]
MVTMFIDTLPSPFYSKAVGSVASNFANLVTMGERIEFGIKRGKFAHANTSSNFARKTRYEKKAEANPILINPTGQGKGSSTAQVILNKLGASTPADSLAKSKVDLTNSSNAPSNRSSGRSRVFTPLPMTYTTLFPLLLYKNMIVVLPLKPLEPLYPRSYDLNAKCDYHVGVVGHSTERCWGFKHKENELNVNTNPLLTHGGQSINTLSHEVLDKAKEDRASLKKLRYDPIPRSQTSLIIQAPAKPKYKDNHVPSAEPKDGSLVGEATNIAGPGGMTRSGKIYTPENLGRKISTTKKSTESPKDVPKGKLIRHSEYKLLDQMNKTPARISLLSLLLNSESHQNLLLKILNEAHAAQDITVERFGGIVNNITSRGRVTFLEEEVPTEGRRHNQPLHISIKCGD